MPRRAEPKSEVAFRNAKARALPYLLTDGNGLALRVWPNGSKTWLFRYRRPGTGKENFLSLGPYPDTSLIDARKAALTARTLVRAGTDPVTCQNHAWSPRPNKGRYSFRCPPFRELVPKNKL